ncbi:MAG: FAD-dependent monooxygenase [Thermoplasmatota archaeon]
MLAISVDSIESKNKWRNISIQNFDFAVVGAGPAGSTAAKFLAEKGIKVLLIDKKIFPRDKPCGGGITMKTLKRFTYIDNLIETYSYGGTYSFIVSQL